MQHIQELVAEDFSAVNQTILDQLHSRVGLVENIGHYITEAGGKRLRPLITLLAANALGYKGNKHIELAVVIEFIHTATLLHDDVVDISSLRRGRPTANANWGNAPSVLVGDFIYSRAFQMLVAIGDMEIMALLSDTTNQIAEGEVLQLTKAGDPDCSREEYLRVIRDKTAILFAGALKGAAIIADQPETIQVALYQYGLDLGIAFQLADDVLDYEGDAKVMGKNVGDDLSEGKPTLPLIYSIEQAQNGEADIVIEAIQQKSAENISDILELVQSNGALDYTREFAQKYVDSARQQLNVLPESPFRDALEQLAGFAVNRKA
ncbi:Octaprenyl diphosphate synthase [BD1-7 clade bacterium]|uniref:Octaprenyl diphosphate synthase n=1 Tax=BD1-7 clade bacterium TaxID=2029982 RepID=A0A5S9P4P4_9GAMM|nr:Octaprenyl diphosphate synthase [BD1-7 clade bacterium]CAA0098313.1 Octaprenyl diphosphate synthase [BD1-7 clade bacterium]